jgi:hypothetical protein
MKLFRVNYYGDWSGGVKMVFADTAEQALAEAIEEDRVEHNGQFCCCRKPKIEDVHEIVGREGLILSYGWAE